MSIAKLILMLINANSCKEILKNLFLDDTKIFMDSIEEALGNGLLNGLVEDNENHSLSENVKEYHLTASLIAISLYGSGVHISKAVHKVLDTVANELSSYSDDALIDFVKSLGINADFNDKCFASSTYVTMRRGKYVITKLCYRYRIHFVDYIRMARNLLTEESWRIISYPISKGYVYIDRRDRVIRLIIEYLRGSLTAKLRLLSDSCQQIKSLLDSTQISEKIKDIVKAGGFGAEEKTVDSQSNLMASSTRYHFENINSVEDLYRIAQKFFPPCVRDIMEYLSRGENLSHHQRFALATFLINIGVPQEILIDLFRRSPDFNERITKYQIEHLAGLRGSKKRYLTYSCNTMKTLGMCRWECGIRNPVQYPYRAAMGIGKRVATIDKDLVAKESMDSNTQQ
ncbi:MAG: hypothetical protein QXM62_01795 [Ignisphaera sp.]